MYNEPDGNGPFIRMYEASLEDEPQTIYECERCDNQQHELASACLKCGYDTFNIIAPESDDTYFNLDDYYESMFVDVP